MTILLSDGHIHPWHEREMVSHMTFIAFTEVVANIFRPLIDFGKKNAVRVIRIHHRAHLFYNGVRFRQILVLGALTHTQIRDRVQTNTVYA